MHRDIDKLTARTFDVLVVGGGIYGLAIAYDAAQRGLTAALIEADDFGSGASFNHLRTIHGGLRYLQTLDLGRARESIRERRILARIAPHAVQPLAFVLPLRRSATKGKLAMQAGFLIDRCLAFDRNHGVPKSHRLPAGVVLSREAAFERVPEFDRRSATGAGLWYDYQTIEADRLTFAWALAASECGATLANHIEATTPMVEAAGGSRRVVGVRAHDRESAREIEIAARVTVNATGAGVDRLLAPLGLSAPTALLKAMNLVTRRPGGNHALGGSAPSGRHLFLVPWRGRGVFGTWESDRVCAPGDATVNEAEVAGFVADLNQTFPSLDLRMDDVTLVHHALVPATIGADGRVSLQGHERVCDHASQGVEGLVTVAGTKYTTARAVAERVTDRLAAKLDCPSARCRTATVPLPGGALHDVALTVAEAHGAYDALVPAEAVAHLVAAYGSRFRDVVGLASTQSEWCRPVCNDSPVIGAQLIWAVRREMARTLCDAVVRRTPLGGLGYPGDAGAERAARLVGDELHWSDERRRDELAALRRFYPLGERVHTKSEESE